MLCNLVLLLLDYPMSQYVGKLPAWHSFFIFIFLLLDSPLCLQVKNWVENLSSLQLHTFCWPILLQLTGGTYADGWEKSLYWGIDPAPALATLYGWYFGSLLYWAPSPYSLHFIYSLCISGIVEESNLSVQCHFFFGINNKMCDKGNDDQKSYSCMKRFSRNKNQYSLIISKEVIFNYL